MTVYLSSIVGSASIGVYTLATEDIVIVPRMVPKEKAQEIADWLKVKLVYTSISGSVLAGALACANSSGMLLSNAIREEELTQIKSAYEGNITIMETKRNAFGNLILANDKGAVLIPGLKSLKSKRLGTHSGSRWLRRKLLGYPTLAP